MSAKPARVLGQSFQPQQAAPLKVRTGLAVGSVLPAVSSLKPTPALEQTGLGSTIKVMLLSWGQILAVEGLPSGFWLASKDWNDFFSLFSSWWALSTPVTLLVFSQKKKTAVSIPHQIPWQRFYSILSFSQMFVSQDWVATRLLSISASMWYGTTYLSRISWLHCEVFLPHVMG